MHWVASIILSFVFQMAHVVEGAEQPLPADNMNEEWSVHQLRTTSDFARNNKFIDGLLEDLIFKLNTFVYYDLSCSLPKISSNRSTNC